MAISERSVFAVTGGARGVTARCAIGMAHRYQCVFILIGRTSLATPEPTWAIDCADRVELYRRVVDQLAGSGEVVSPIEVRHRLNAIEARREVARTLSAIEEAGGRAHYISVDITDESALRAALAGAIGRAGPIDGLIHAAGVVMDKLIQRKTEQDYEAVFRPKVIGLRNMLACLPPHSLRHIFLFSSMSAVNGSAGQSDYAIANEILNKSAYFLRLSHPWCRIVAFDWGRIDGGMVTPELKKIFEDAGKAVIPLDVAVNTFLAVLGREDQVQGQIVVGAPATTEPIPLHAQPLMGPELRTYRVRRTLSLDVNPFVRDHIVAGHPVLPMVAAITWMAGTCEGLYPRHHVIRIDDIALLKGIVFDSDLAPEYILDLTEVSKGGSGEVDVDATLWSVTASGQTRYHYKCRIALATHLVDPPSTHPVDTLSREQWVDGGLFYRDGTLFHGPSFQGIRKVLAAADQSMVLECAVPATPDAHLGQFRSDALNPLTTDVSLQSLLVWTRSHRGAAALPARIGRVELFRSIKPGETFYAWMQVKASDENRVSADVVTADYGGRVHARFSDAEVTLSRQLNRLFQGAATG